LGRRKKTEYFRNCCVGVHTPTLLWLEYGRKEWRKRVRKCREETRESR